MFEVAKRSMCSPSLLFVRDVLNNVASEVRQQPTQADNVFLTGTSSL
jgi:hypothetical protein